MKTLDDSNDEVGKGYKKKLISGASIVTGLFLIIEHIIVFGQLEFWDFLGHEWLGIILVILGLSGFTRFKRKDGR